MMRVEMMMFLYLLTMMRPEVALDDNSPTSITLKGSNLIYYEFRNVSFDPGGKKANELRLHNYYLFRKETDEIKYDKNNLIVISESRDRQDLVLTILLERENIQEGEKFETTIYLGEIIIKIEGRFEHKGSKVFCRDLSDFCEVCNFGKNPLTLRDGRVIQGLSCSEVPSKVLRGDRDVIARDKSEKNNSPSNL